MSYIVRDARPGDEAVILSLIKELADFQRLGHEVTATPEALKSTLFSDAPKVFALIVEHDGIACGYAIYFFNYSTFTARHGIYLEDLCVSAAHRGAGVGKMLMQRLAAIASSNDCERLYWAVLDWNEKAKAFYENLGAAPIDDWVPYRLSDDAFAALASEASL